jgi:Kyakuja-Dileera-Zisupton transposase
MVAKALELLGERQLVGYDIGCAFRSTIESSLLGESFRQLNCRTCVNAFHGYSHNYACQVRDHPNNIEGMGVEDLETLERVFSASNALAGVTRYMSAYRRRVFYDLFFKQWDAEKYANLGTMLYNNYTQALRIIDDGEVAVQEAVRSLNIAGGDLDKWIIEEADYFSKLGKEPEWDIHAMAYVELLQEWRAIE